MILAYPGADQVSLDLRDGAHTGCLQTVGARVPMRSLWGTVTRCHGEASSLHTSAFDIRKEEKGSVGYGWGLGLVCSRQQNQIWTPADDLGINVSPPSGTDMHLAPH